MVNPVKAGDPPTLTSPTNNSTVSSSSLNWQTPPYPLYSSKPYRVQIDDDPAFSSPNKDYYTNNTYYTPSLDYGSWHWRLKAKDSSASWSNWSNSWSFVLNASLSSSTPTPQPTQTPTPNPSPLPASFIINNVPSQINSSDSFNASVDLFLPNNPNALFYLKGAFKKIESSNYFGLTKVSGNWIKNNSNYSQQLPITTDSSGNWSGGIEVKADTEDSGFSGNGNYTFKVGRYSASGNLEWSNEIVVNIQHLVSETSTEVSTNQTPPPTSQPLISASPKIITSQKTFKQPDYKIASVAAVTTTSTPSASREVEVKENKQFSPVKIVGLLFILAGLATLGYIFFKSGIKSKTDENLPN